MPTRATESYSYTPGSLVLSTRDIYSSPSIDGDGGNEEPGRVSMGTVGLILEGPNIREGYRDHCRVQFLNRIVWWVNFGEIEPYY